ncbi:MAG: ABC transporter substrate-binding protein [Deltaproteobacteria bacterium]
MDKPIPFRWFATLLLMLGFLLLIFSIPHAHSTAVEPQQVVKETVERILALIKDPKLAGKEKEAEKRQLIIAAVEKRFDFREMSRSTLAVNWRSITPEQRDVFVKLFTQLLENTYISKIEQYSDEKILYKGQEIRGHRAVVVSSVIHNGVETPLIYRMSNSSGQWLVYDVIIEGVSLVSNYRSQFSDILEKEQFSGLITRIKQKIEGKEEQ